MASGWHSSRSRCPVEAWDAHRVTRILALCGSLRAQSSNTAILRVAARVAPVGVVLELYPGLDALPFFNPDLDRALDDPALPPAV